MSTPPPGEAGTSFGGVPVCPRHPSRESYVRCQRCERPVCPECQRPAAVGVQCVDCVAGQRRSMPQVRGLFGGGVVQRPLVTMTIMALCGLAWVLQAISQHSHSPLSTSETVTQRFEFFPPLVVSEPWRFLTSAFLHYPTFPFSLVHLGFNMWALWNVGQILERVLGQARFAAVYLLSAVGGSVGYLLLIPAGPGSDWYLMMSEGSGPGIAGAVGASGAVFGLFGAFFVVNRRLGRDSTAIISLIVVNGMISFYPGIAWQAHLGGLVTGAIAAATIAYAPREKRTLLQTLGLVGVAVLLLVVTIVRVEALPSFMFV